MRRLIYIWIFSLVLLLSACSLPAPSSSPSDGSAPSSDSSRPAPSTALSLAFNREDSLDPCRASTKMNRYLTSLLYEGLTLVGDGYEVEPVLAAQIETPDAQALKVTLRAQAVFSNGDRVTAADVVSSFQRAKSSTAYGPLLTNIASAKANEDQTITFTLASPDPNARACLSFPISQSESPLVGSGPYVFDASNETLNVNSHAAVSVTIPTIQLVHCESEDEALRLLESGQISYWFHDFSAGYIPRLSSGWHAVPMPSLLYLGMNQKNKALESAAVRRAISLAVDRISLTSEAFAGYAVPALTPFPADWEPAKEVPGFSLQKNPAESVAQLAACGYNNMSSIDNPSSPLSLKLLVNNENAFRLKAAHLLSEQLEAAGVQVTIETMPYARYLKALQTGQFDLYLGEVRLSADLHLRALLSPGGEAAFGLPSSSVSVEAYVKVLSGELSLAAFGEIFQTDVPFLPLCWRQGAVAYVHNLLVEAPSALSVYANLPQWRFSG